MRCKHSQIVSVITHNRCDPEDCVTAYDIAVGESVPRYIKGLTHRPDVARGWDPQLRPAGSVVMDDREWFNRVTAQEKKIQPNFTKKQTREQSHHPYKPTLP